jgi:Ala-tRNA(Pro) deacylase
MPVLERCVCSRCAIVDNPEQVVKTMPPFGNLYEVPAYADNTLAEEETIVFTAGTYTVTMSVSYADFERLLGPTVADLADHAGA